MSSGRDAKLTGHLLTGALVVALVGVPTRYVVKAIDAQAMADSTTAVVRASTVGRRVDWALTSLKDVPLPDGDGLGRWRLVLVSGRGCEPCVGREASVIRALDSLPHDTPQIEFWLVNAAPRATTDFNDIDGRVFVRQLKLARVAEFMQRWTSTVPTVFVVDPSGRVANAWVGYSQRGERDEIVGAVRAMAGEHAP